MSDNAILLDIVTLFILRRLIQFYLAKSAAPG